MNIINLLDSLIINMKFQRIALSLKRNMEQL